ncbi:MAG TPA: FkbM family methyltransferase, partial [Magnetospirillaceae bacterium]
SRWLEERYYLVFGEPELALIPLLCDPSRDAIDVGANHGCYAMIMRKYARQVIAFEPNPALSSQLADKFSDDVTVRPLALSRSSGMAELHVPIIDGRDVSGLASLDDSHPLPGAGDHEIVVPTRALDDAFWGDVGFIKIDVEGHESAVLEGAHTTIARCRPKALVELEERHAVGAIGRARQFFSDLNYQGYFLREGRVRPIEEFDATTMQRSEDVQKINPQRVHAAPDTYTNNFLFVPAEQSGLIGRLNDALRSRVLVHA